ncbi:MAG: carboxypeptidase-like regulatory domain-containing protein [Pirellulales bacterium]|nr:carboxypeptidase regulatory-like domain-containing protein [Planctomycetales bacterium]
MPASGVVTYEGEPVEAAQVMFMPSSDRMATGVTDAEGRFELSTFEPGDGVVIGQHKVTVTKRLPDPNNDSPYPQFFDALPPNYSNPANSGLSADVTADGENVFLFELEGPVTP